MRVLDFPSSEKLRDIAGKYGYDEFILRRWMHFFGEEAMEIVRAFEEGIPKYIRVNTIKIEEDILIERLRDRGFELEKTDISYCYEVREEPYSVGATPEFLMGYYYIMDKASCIPPIVLDPKPGEVVVDLASSPGGKTTFLSMLMGNKGVVLAVEPQKERLQPLIDNIHRMGAMNVAVLKMDGRDVVKLKLRADRVLLDAPCTGEGVIHKDPSRKTDRGEKDILFCSNLQRELILAGFDCLKEGGVMVYSTCSLTPEENEMVIDFLLESRDARLEKVDFGNEALTLPELKLRNPEEIKKASRFYPHKHRCSGFFVARIRKSE
ncbi:MULTISPECIES: NOL1/NOP2/sun family putative RNA methylase [unclassified Archaeoglobus]|jgi:NOL1/NOP2/sun family putative RNA methylase|uniref:NOL1/NOP2/sun family putative RNA methylase n=1 Tax=unclassified Archaeoglobus TaxID=2643606 RepID=UPI0025C26563|nr:MULTISPECIES: NOL1/NOP2/sun family putative RNA methylase [unclassified Archaeoglobus]